MLIVTTSCARLLTAITASQRFADASSTSVTALIVGPSGVPFRKDSSPFKGQRPCQPHMEHYARKLACDLRLARPVPAQTPPTETEIHRLRMRRYTRGLRGARWKCP